MGWRYVDTRVEADELNIASSEWRAGECPRSVLRVEAMRQIRVDNPEPITHRAYKKYDHRDPCDARGRLPRNPHGQVFPWSYEGETAAR